MIQLAYHNPSSCQSLESYFQFEEKSQDSLMDDYSVTINASGDQPCALTRMIGDLLWALQREGHISNHDLVHVNVCNDSLTSHFENQGFHHFARCIKEYPEQRLTSNPFEGENRMAARVGDLLQVLVDSGISLPQPHVTHTKRPRLN